MALRVRLAGDSAVWALINGVIAAVGAVAAAINGIYVLAVPLALSAIAFFAVYLSERNK